MKKLILSAVAIAFAVAVQAGDAKNGQTSKSCPAQAKSSCCAAKGSEQTKVQSKGKETAAKQPLASPKAKSLASK